MVDSELNYESEITTERLQGGVIILIIFLLDV